MRAGVCRAKQTRHSTCGVDSGIIPVKYFQWGVVRITDGRLISRALTTKILGRAALTVFFRPRVECLVAWFVSVALGTLKGMKLYAPPFGQGSIPFVVVARKGWVNVIPLCLEGYVPKLRMLMLCSVGNISHDGLLGRRLTTSCSV